MCLFRSASDKGSACQHLQAVGDALIDWATRFAGVRAEATVGAGSSLPSIVIARFDKGVARTSPPLAGRGDDTVYMYALSGSVAPGGALDSRAPCTGRREGDLSPSCVQEACLHLASRKSDAGFQSEAMPRKNPTGVRESQLSAGVAHPIAKACHRDAVACFHTLERALVETSAEKRGDR